MASQQDRQQGSPQGTTLFSAGAQPLCQSSLSSPRRRSTADLRSSSTTSRYVPSPPANTPRVSTASARAWHLIELDRSMLNLRYNHGDTSSSSEDSGGSGILGLSKRIRERIWRLVLVQPRNVVVCGCRSCERLGDVYLPLTQVCRSIREQTLSIFYSSNRFMMPVGHNTTKSAQDWLLSISKTCRRHIRHFEVPSLDIPTTVLAMRQTSQMQLATNLSNRKEITLNGEKILVSWPIFRATIPEIDGDSSASSPVESVGSSILGSVSDLSLADEDVERFITPQHITIRQNLPILRLTLENGQEVEPPEWAFPQQRHRIIPSRDPPAVVPRSAEREYSETGLQIVRDCIRASRYSSRSWVTHEAE